MKTFRLLGSASCLAILAWSGGASALEQTLQSTPISVRTISAQDIEFYVGPGLSGFNAGIIVPDVSAGAKINLRGLGAPRASFSVDGTVGMQTPGSVTEMWVGSRLGFQLDDVSRIEILTGGGVGVINNTGVYKGSLGLSIPIMPKADILLEGVARGPIGGSPTDFGGRIGLNFYPNGDTSLDSDKVFDSGFITSPTSFWGGGSLTVVPSASKIVPTLDAGVKFNVGNNFDIGLRGSLGLEFPGGAYSAWAGGEAGYTITPQVRTYGALDFGSIGGFYANRLTAGLEYKFDPALSLIGEFGGRGGIGTISEFTFRTGIRYDLTPGLGDTNIDPVIPKLGDLGLDPYVGKSIAGIPTGGGIAIPALDFGLNLPMENGIVPGLRGQVGYQLPAGVLEGWAGGQLGFQATPRVQPFVFLDLGNIGGGFAANRVGFGTEFKVDPSWGINAEVFGRGGLGAITEGGFKLGARWHPKPPETTLGFRYQW